MSAGDSALYRATPGLTRPLFIVTAGTHSWSDSGIHAITITHGKQDPGGGIHPATAEIEVGGAVGILNDRHITVRLNNSAATALAGATAAGTRFTGRVATQRVRQAPRPGQDPAVSSVLACSSWSSLYLAAGRGIVETYPSTLGTLTQTMFTYSAKWAGRTIPLVLRGDWSDQMYESSYGDTFSDLVSKFYAEPGRLLRQRRDGTVEALTLGHRAAGGEAAAAAWYPITPGHVVGEVEHEQDVDSANVGIQLRWRETDPNDSLKSTVVSRNWAWRGSRDGVPATDVAEWRTYDWTHTSFRTEEYRHGINALSLQAFRVAYSTPRITVDLLQLARSTRHYDSVLLPQLLKLEHGDPVTLGGDWSSWWNGLYYAEQITERITPDEWTLELALYPPQEVTGWYGTGGAPTIPARLWSQATYPWSAETRNWSDAQ